MKTLGVGHVGLAARDPLGLAGFYREVMGMTLAYSRAADQASPFGAMAFLSGRPDEEEHELVFVERPTGGRGHTAFRVASLDDLRDWYRHVRACGVAVTLSVVQGPSVAFYFADPEENRVEIYWATGLRFPAHFPEPVDLEAPTAELLAVVERAAAERGVALPPGWPARGQTPAETMRELLRGYQRTQLLHVAAELGIADRLGGGPKSAGSLGGTLAYVEAVPA